MKTMIFALVVGLNALPLFAADALFVQVDKEKREVRVAAEATKRIERAGKIWPIEVLLCGEHGKMHETVFHTKAKPSEIHKTLEAIGLKKGDPAVVPEAAEDGKYHDPKGEKVDIFVEWSDASGKSHREPWQKMLITGPGSSDPRVSTARGEMKDVAPSAWLFVGSQMGLDPDSGKEIYGGDLNLSIATVNHQDATAVLQLPGNDKDGYIFETSTAAPSPGTKVTLVFTPAQ